MCLFGAIPGLRLVVYPIIYKALYMPGGWPWDFWTINSSTGGGGGGGTLLEPRKLLTAGIEINTLAVAGWKKMIPRMIIT